MKMFWNDGKQLQEWEVDVNGIHKIEPEKPKRVNPFSLILFSILYVFSWLRYGRNDHSRTH